eukprot:GHVU01195674.1.p1 GENE.GHVU01195674.1~~GHVU01195674.1.p1  ORF type:complete len:179 (+),score=15.19 GHVU01195674.1:264-800(+)
MMDMPSAVSHDHMDPLLPPHLGSVRSINRIYRPTDRPLASPTYLDEYLKDEVFDSIGVCEGGLEGGRVDELGGDALTPLGGGQLPLHVNIYSSAVFRADSVIRSFIHSFDHSSIRSIIHSIYTRAYSFIRHSLIVNGSVSKSPRRSHLAALASPSAVKRQRERSAISAIYAIAALVMN